MRRSLTSDKGQPRINRQVTSTWPSAVQVVGVHWKVWTGCCQRIKSRINQFSSKSLETISTIVVFRCTLTQWETYGSRVAVCNDVSNLIKYNQPANTPSYSGNVKCQPHLGYTWLGPGSMGLQKQKGICQWQSSDKTFLLKKKCSYECKVYPKSLSSCPM